MIDRKFIGSVRATGVAQTMDAPDATQIFVPVRDCSSGWVFSTDGWREITLPLDGLRSDTNIDLVVVDGVLQAMPDVQPDFMTEAKTR